MRNKFLIMTALAIVFGTAAVFLTNVYVTSQTASEGVSRAEAAPDVAFATLVVARTPLVYGDRLTSDVLKEIAWPGETLPDGAYATLEDAMSDGDRVVLSPISANAPVLKSDLSGPDGRASLSNMLDAGKRAETVRVDEEAGVGGFITPGDRVDVVLTRQESGTTLSQIILQNIKVLSTDHMADTSSTQPRETRWVTLEVDTASAKRLTLARSIGEISLSLRAAGDQMVVTDPLVTMSDLAAFPEAPTPAVDNQVVSSVTNDDPGFFEPPKKTTFEIVVTRALESQDYSVPGDVGAGEQGEAR